LLVYIELKSETKTTNKGEKEMEELAMLAVEKINGYRSNKTIMDFVTKEAREKVAAEIRAEYKGGTTYKAVELLEIRHQNIKDRVNTYIDAGLVGCYMASFAQ